MFSMSPSEILETFSVTGVVSTACRTAPIPPPKFDSDNAQRHHNNKDNKADHHGLQLQKSTINTSSSDTLDPPWACSEDQIPTSSSAVLIDHVSRRKFTTTTTSSSHLFFFPRLSALVMQSFPEAPLPFNTPLSPPPG